MYVSNFSYHLSVNAHFDCLHFLVVVNSTAINMGILRVAAVFLRFEADIIFHNGCTNLLPECTRVPFPQHPSP